MPAVLEGHHQPSTQTPSRRRPATPKPSPHQQLIQQIGKRLHAAYDGTVQDPLPVRLADLVERLARRESGEA